MKTAVPWNVRGIRPEARETARIAARRAGMSVADWLNAVIIESAAEDGVLPDDFDGAGDDHDLVSINRRLDRLTRQLDRFVALAAGQPVPEEPKENIPEEPPSLEDAVAEISARQRTLDGDLAAPEAAQSSDADLSRPPAPSAESPAPPSAAPSAPAVDISGLEQQLRVITAKIEALNKPSGLDDAVAMLRKDLAEIGRTVTAALPRRAVEALEGELRAVAQKVDQTRQCGFDPKAVTAMERTLADMREALRALTPAEKLVGFGEAINRLSDRVDEMLTRQDPAVLQQLEATISALRNIVANVASNEALARLAEDVRNLSGRIDQIGKATPSGAVDAISSLDRRIAMLSEQIQASAAEVGATPRIESMLKELSQRLEQAQAPQPGGTVAVAHLAERIAGLSQKLDASDSRMSNLAAVERGMSDLLLRLDEMRSDKGGGRDAAAAIPPAVDALKRDVSRTQDSLEEIHGTLGHVVDRLAMIETDMRKPGAASPAAHAQTLPAKPAAAAGERPPIKHGLPPDYPLEPGSGRPASPVDRIAASEAAIHPAKAAAAPQETQTNFIAAARRAAQIASTGAQPSAKFTASAPAEAKAGSKAIGKRVIVGISVLLIVVGGLRIVTNMLDQSSEPAAEVPVSGEPASGNGKGEATQKNQGSQSSLIPREVPPAGPATPPAAKSENQKPAPDEKPAGISSDVTGSIPLGPLSIPSPLAVPAPAIAPPLPAPPPASLPQSLRAAAEAGDPAAAYELGVRHFEGRGIPANAAEAAQWFERAAKAELAPAQFRLGSMYEKGQGVAKDLNMARTLYLAATDKGNAKAMHNLAVLYAEGIDGKPDYKQAAVWFRKGAERGVADSQYNLGILYARGIGVERNLTESFKWFSLAAAGGDKDAARKRDDVGSRLDPQSLAAARQAVETWTAVPQPEEAVTVKSPPGGWDNPSKKPRVAAPAKPGR